MRILVLFRQDKSMSAAVPMPVLMEMVEATHHYLEDLKKKGKLSDGAIFAGTHGGFAIFNVASLGEFHELCELVPVRPITTTEIYPIAEPSEFAKTLQKVKGQAQQMWQKLQQVGAPH